MTGGSAPARAALESYRACYAHPARLGCSLVAHRDLGFCTGCLRADDGVCAADLELAAWRLLAAAERGVPDQPPRGANR